MNPNIFKQVNKIFCEVGYLEEVSLIIEINLFSNFINLLECKTFKFT